MTWNLFIDDERNLEDVTWAPWQVQEKYRNEEWVIVRNYGDAIVEVFNRGFPSYISFDHDLGDNSKTGYDIAKQLVENDMISGERESRKSYKFSADFDFYVHSKNPVGAENIRNYLSNYFYFKHTR